MADPALLQKQIKDNSEDLHNFVRDLNLWEKEMKRKDRQLSNEKTDEVLPPVRRPKLTEKPKEKKDSTEPEEEKPKLRSYDYKAWDKFDVEKACEEIDNENKKEETIEDSDAAEQEEKYQKDKGLYEKELGNQHVKAGRWDKAIECYTRAISAYSKDPVFFANRALCHLKKKQYEQVERDCTEALKLDSTYVKALMRRAAAREALSRLEDARHDLTRSLQLEPRNTQAQQDLTRVKSAVEGKTKLVKSSVKKDSPAPDNKKELKPSIPSQPNADKPANITPTSITKAKEDLDKERNEPNWLPCENTIQPINKPPHLRSKKSLKRIEIIDVGLNTPEHVCPRKLASKEVVAEAPQVHQSVVDKEEPPQVIKTKHIFSVSCPEPAGNKLPPVPKNSVQFHNSWSRIKTDRTLCYEFLKQIPGRELPDIFKESLESGMFSSIVDVLATEFVSAKECVMPYLRGLSGVRRFTTLVLFMSSADKANLTTLFKFCENNEECSLNEINELKRVYEVL